MRFIVSSSALFNRLQTIGRVINSKNTLPILDCFLFEIQDNILTITASDSETTLITNLELVESDANARFCINAKTIQDSMKEIAEQPLSFDINPDNMEITANYQNGRFNIVGQSADEYPEMNLPQEDMNALIIPAETMLNGINRCLFATADDELRPVMNGVYFDIQADNLTFVSTDGHKLVRNRNYGIKDHQPAAFILPKKPATILKNLLPKESDDVTLKFNERNAYITMESSRLICRLIEGRYPNYNSVIPGYGGPPYFAERPETRIDILQPKQRFDQVASGKQSVGSLRTRHRLLHLGRGTRALRIRRLSDEYRFQGYVPHRHTEQYGGRKRHHRAGRPEPGRSNRPGRAGRKRRPADAADAYDAERLKE